MICKKFAKSKQNIHLAKSKQNKIFIPFGTKQNKILITAQFELWKKMTFLRVKILKIWPKNEPLPSPILIFEAGLPEGFGISFGISSQNHLGSPQIRSVKINYPPPSNCMTKEMTSHIVGWYINPNSRRIAQKVPGANPARVVSFQKIFTNLIWQPCSDFIYCIVYFYSHLMNT